MFDPTTIAIATTAVGAWCTGCTIYTHRAGRAIAAIVRRAEDAEHHALTVRNHAHVWALKAQTAAHHAEQAATRAETAAASRPAWGFGAGGASSDPFFAKATDLLAPPPGAIPTEHLAGLVADNVGTTADDAPEADR